MDWIACMFHLEEEHAHYLEQTLLSYDIGLYLIGFENDKYPHFHVLFQGDTKIYTNFSKKIVEKFKLRGKAKDGKSRQYGKVKDIESVDKMAAYTLKDGNIRTNMEEKDLEKYRSISYKKNEEKKLFLKILDKLVKQCGQASPRTLFDDWKSTLRQKIISIIIQETGPDFYFTKSLVEKIMLTYLRVCCESTLTIYEPLYCR